MSGGRLATVGVAVGLAVLVGMISIPVSALVVSFPDPELEEAIRYAIGRPTGDINDTDLVGLTFVNAGGRSIASLEGIQHCVDLTALWLYDNEIDDISTLAVLANLTDLRLWANEIVDISPLSGLTNLTVLSMYRNEVVDISALAGLINLTELYLDENEIADIHGLVDNPGLSEGDLLDLRYNFLDLTPGSPDMLNIEALQGRGVRVDFDPQNPPRVVVNFPDSELRAAIRDAIGKLTGDIHDTDLIGLTFLDINDWGVTNPEGMQYCVDLAELGLWENEIVDIGALAGLTNLTSLNLCRNQIVDISPLSDLTNLTVLSLYRNEVIDISTLAGLTNLSELYLDENEIVDIQALIDNPGLGDGDLLDLRYNYLDLTPGSPDMLHIEALQGRGVRVDFDPQN